MRIWIAVFSCAVLLGVPRDSLAADMLDDDEPAARAYARAVPAVVTVNTRLRGRPASGSGVIIEAGGWVVTSRHVVEDARQVLVSLADGRRMKGWVVAKGSPPMDLALLRLEGVSRVPALPLGNSDRLRVGQTVLAIGNPYGFERSLTRGIVSRLDPQRQRIQTDAAINPGSSGGPLLNRHGELVGLNLSLYNPEGGHSNLGIGFAVPANSIRGFLRQTGLGPWRPVETHTVQLPPEPLQPTR